MVLVQEGIEVFVLKKVLLLYDLSVDVWGSKSLDLRYEKITNPFKRLW